MRITVYPNMIVKASIMRSLNTSLPESESSSTKAATLSGQTRHEVVMRARDIFDLFDGAEVHSSGVVTIGAGDFHQLKVICQTLMEKTTREALNRVGSHFSSMYENMQKPTSVTAIDAIFTMSDEALRQRYRPGLTER